uniref:CUB domain-containing protein n=1 Tax=Rhabditophanes sp. KR3021 TaxID=114890 RepID=A0AC35UF03_9BILA
MTLWFHSDRSNVATGFSGFYNELDSSNIVKFGGINGILASANYPNNYNTYADEHYLISIPEKQSMNITFTEISLQSAYTTLTLYDGPSESYPLLATYSGHVILNSANATLYATQNMVTVVFKSEYPLSDRGFSLGWTS